MSNTVTDNGTSLSTMAATPAIRTFQIDPSGLGGISESVNLFRGDLTVPLSLITLAGRSGLEATASIICQSNVLKDVDTWNLEAPTGPVGLGWSMGFEFIALDMSGSIALNDVIYYLVADGSSNRLRRTVVAGAYWEFEAEQFKFWRIRYYPAEEKWEIVKENGNRSIYGGSTVNPATAPVQFGVKWGGPFGNWTGSSIATTAQEHFCVAWNLAQVLNPWEDGMQFEYENDVVPIGDGLYYTRSSRLKRVTLPFAYSMTYNYAPKEHNGQIREYTIPHTDPTAPSLAAYQDRFETLYLESIIVNNADDAPSDPGTLLLRIGFEYSLVNMAIGQQGNPDFYKRYLTQITMTPAQGTLLPSIDFEYYNDPNRDLNAGTNRGALRSLLYPQGGSVRYVYEATTLSGTERTQELGQLSTPRTWFGDDYMVLTECDGTLRGLTVRIFSWNGLWVEAPREVNVPVQIDLDSLNVSIQSDFFVVSFQTTGASPLLYIIPFHKEKGRYGQWYLEEAFSTLRVGGGGQGLVVTGQRFFAACASGGDTLVNVWDQRLEVWVRRDSVLRPDPSARYAMAAAQDYLTFASQASNTKEVRLALYYLDALNLEFLPGSLQVQSIPVVEWQDGVTPFSFWSLGVNFAVMTYVTRHAGNNIEYALAIQQWDTAFNAVQVLNRIYTVPDDTNLPYASTVVSGSVVGNVYSMFRFDGTQWREGALPVPAGNSDPRFAYGSDAAIVSSEGGASIALFDPFSLRWQVVRSIPNVAAGIKPTISGEYLTVGREVYYRGNEGNLQFIFLLDNNMLAASLVNRAPGFIAYVDGNTNTHIFPTENGAVNAGAEIQLPNQTIYVDGNAAGTSLVGASALLTYRGSFDNPSEATAYAYVNHGIEGAVTTYPIAALEIDDGYSDGWGDAQGVKSTRYYFDCANVTILPGGDVAEFAAATAVFGAPYDHPGVCYPAPDITPFGRSESRFHNNRSPIQTGLAPDAAGLGSAAYYYSYLNGMLFDKTDYDAAGELMERVANLYDVRTDYETVNQPGIAIPIIGAYVQQTEALTSRFEEVITLDAVEQNDMAGALAPPRLVAALAARDVFLPDAVIMPARTGNRWRLYPDRTKQFFLPVALEGGTLTASVAVERRVGYEFSAATGLQTADWTDNYTSYGDYEVIRRQIYYAWQVPEYAILRDLHVWSPVILSIKFQQEAEEPSPGVPVEIALTTLQEWRTPGIAAMAPWAPRRAYTGLTANAYDPGAPVPVHFTDWTNAGLPDPVMWRSLGEVTARSPYGVVLEALDVEGRPSATLLDVSWSRRIAGFTNAGRNECAYLGFEQYESRDGWLMSSGEPVSNYVIDGDAHTGYSSLRLAPGAPSMERPMFLRSDGTIYVLAYWVKTRVGYDEGPGASTWEVLVNGAVRDTFVIGGTSGGWAYRNHAIAISDGGPAPAAVIIRVRNSKVAPEDSILLDDIMAGPLVGAADAIVYGLSSGEQVAALALNGATARNLVDSFGRVGASANSLGQVAFGNALYLVRQMDRSHPFVFPAGAPNSLLSITPAEGGSFANLVQGDGWMNEWLADAPEHWRVEHGQLIHTIAGQESIKFVPTVGLDNYGARVSVQLPLDPAGDPILPASPLGMAIGDDLVVTWTPGIGWSMRLAEETFTLPVTDFFTEWLLLAPVDPVTGATAVYFFANGRQLFAKLAAPVVSGTLRLFVSDAGIAFFSVATFVAPRLESTYLDGSGKERQKQSFTGTGTLVSGNVYDAIGRPALGVKTTLLQNAPLGYAEAYVETFDPVTGVMTGLAATAYPEDEGYPYVRTEFYPNALSVARKQGLPGSDFAIVQSGVLGAEVDENLHITLYEYGTNQVGTFGGDIWPSNQYFVTRTTDPNGAVRYELTSKADQTIAVVNAPGDAGADLVTTQYFYDAAGRVVKVLPPAGVAAARAGAPDADRWATITGYNFIGEGITQRSPDTGYGRTQCDLAGRVRFSATFADDIIPPVPGIIRYSKYDPVGRTIEVGWFEGIWDSDFLRMQAVSDPGWPGVTQPHTVAQTFEYDGDGNDPTFFGQLRQVTTRGTDSDIPVVESFTYDLLGNLLTATTTAGGFDNVARVVGYTYNVLGEAERIAYPDGSPLPLITYAHDMLGQVFRIGTPDDPAAVATFEYSPTGAITNAAYNPGAAGAINSQALYNAPGWPTSARAVREQGDQLLLGETISYTSGGYNDAGYFDGKIASVRNEGNGDDYTYKFQYDDLSRLTVAQNTVQSDASIGAGTPTQYDANGNITLIDRGSVTYQNAYGVNSDRLASVSKGGVPIDTYEYDTAGNVSKSGGRANDHLQYDPASGLTISMQLGDALPDGTTNATLGFDYDSNGNRVVKVVQDNGGTEKLARLYIRGIDSSALFEKVRQAGLDAADVQFIHGPAGLVAMQIGARRYTIVRDYLGSVRRIVDETGAVAASFNYGPYGTRIDTPAGKDADQFIYRYTGQEFDSETGLYNYVARLYNPELGRFYASDPASQTDPGGQWISPYIYVANNPVNNVDPDGEEFLSALLIMLIVGAIAGAVAGAVTYATTYQGNFNVGKFFAYAGVGLVAGAAAGGVGYGAGLLATAGLAAAGVSTSTSIASGVVVGAVSGAADGAVGGALNQVLVNLIEQRPAGEGVGMATAFGAGIGGAVGGISGGITGKLHSGTARALENPSGIVAGTANGGLYANLKGIGAANQFTRQQIGAANASLGRNDVLAFAAHGEPRRPVLWFTDAANAADSMTATQIIQDLGGNFNGRGIDLTVVCYAGRSGVAREFASSLNVPVRASWWTTFTYTAGNVGHTVGGYGLVGNRVFRAPIRTFYPSKLKTGWISLFGY